MEPVDYQAMSDRELKQYWRANRPDKAALQAYFDRRNQQPRPIITTLDDPDFDAKLDQEIKRQMNLAPD
jgi:hypothetical protein